MKNVMRLTQTNNAPSTPPQIKQTNKKQQQEKQAFNFVGLFKGNPK